MHFQQLINEVLKSCPFAFGYLDDTVIFSESTEKYFEHLRAVFNKLGMGNLKLKRMM